MAHDYSCIVVPCYSPLTAWRARYVNPDTGRRPLVFNPSEGFRDLELQVPCGQCIGCRLEYSRQWAIRGVHEAQMHDANSFITLTYSNESLPQNRSVDKPTFQRFVKRLRKAVGVSKLRYFSCGEYGELRQRPHYHAVIFGYDFPDKYPFGHNKQGDVLFRSPLLESCWPFGYSSIGQVTFESIAYVARYICKKQKGKDAPDTYVLVDEETGEIIAHQQKEFCLMSRRPGIGTSWFEKYGSDTDKDFITLRGQKMSLPRFYDMLIEKQSSEDEFAQRKGRRRMEAEKRKDDNTLERLRVKERCKEAQLNFLSRDLE